MKCIKAKRWVSIFAALIMLLSVTACTNTKQEESETAEDKPSVEISKSTPEEPAAEDDSIMGFYAGLWKPRLEDTSSWNGGEGLSEEEKESFSELFIRLNEDGSYSANINSFEGEKEGQWHFETDENGAYIELENYGMNQNIFYSKNTDTIVAGEHMDYYRIQ